MKVLIVLLAAFLPLCFAYLFISAPEPLPDGRSEKNAMPIEQALTLLNAENAVARAIYAQEIVGAGQKRGLKFGEDWREPSAERGPLPALFLRETASQLERQQVNLALFLGSDQAIRPANRLNGREREALLAMRADKKARFFFAPDIARRTAMFPDVAVNGACVSCHNAHPQSPKRDWALGDVMGATTWTYPSATLSLEELLKLLNALHRSLESAYGAYLSQVEHFPHPPSIGDRWPRDGYFLPSTHVFMDAVLDHAAPATLEAMIRSEEDVRAAQVPAG